MSIMNKNRHFNWLNVPLAFIFFGTICLFPACNKGENLEVFKNRQMAFYYWRANYAVDSLEKEYVKALNVKRLYLKFFDVDWDMATKQALPVAPLRFETLPDEELSIVPTVFITNQTLQQLPDTLIDSLAQRIGRRLNAMLLQNGLMPQVVELQFDCDWSGSTREKYFKLLRSFALLPAFKQLPLSATVRLHQVKYVQQSGVPPVKRGMLMCYNMGELQALKTDNSILDVGILKKYIGNLEQYPLPLDLGLPLFSWGVLFRNGKYAGLLNGLRVADMATIMPKEQLNEQLFRIKETVKVGNFPLQNGDIVRIEEVNVAQLKATLQALAPHWQTDSSNLIYYHLDPKLLQHYTINDLLHIDRY
jgi:hypothetical protein